MSEVLSRIRQRLHYPIIGGAIGGFSYESIRFYFGRFLSGEPLYPLGVAMGRALEGAAWGGLMGTQPIAIYFLAKVIDEATQPQHPRYANLSRAQKFREATKRSIPSTIIFGLGYEALKFFSEEYPYLGGFGSRIGSGIAYGLFPLVPLAVYELHRRGVWKRLGKELYNITLKGINWARSKT